jgi:pyruvate dehydrogenase E1 component alpha subunit
MNYLNLYQRMVLIRVLETGLLNIAKNEGTISDLHLSRGQEAISVGICSSLRPDDYMVTHHRTIAHSIAKGMAVQPLISEIAWHATGICGGRSNEMHIRDPSIGYVFSFQLVGTGMPVAAGVAWASRYVLKEDKIVVLFIGDGALANAQTLEGLNVAAIRQVPILIIVEDNHRAGNITPDYYFPKNADITTRLKGFGIASLKTDGNKIDEVVDAANKAVELVRKTSFPFALVCDTTRLCVHKIGMGDTRTPEQLAEEAKRDPLKYAERLLGLSESQILEIQQNANSIINELIDKAHAAPWPEPDNILLGKA